jgi:hypothetical protein
VVRDVAGKTSTDEKTVENSAENGDGRALKAMTTKKTHWDE